jgi:hypothetical protein
MASSGWPPFAEHKRQVERTRQLGDKRRIGAGRLPAHAMIEVRDGYPQADMARELVQNPEQTDAVAPARDGHHPVVPEPPLTPMRQPPLHSIDPRITCRYHES